MSWTFVRLRLKEWLEFDSRLWGGALRMGLWLAGLLAYRCGARRRGFRLLSKVHRGGWPRFCCDRVAALLARELAPSQAQSSWLAAHFAEHVAHSPEAAAPTLAHAPERLLRTMAIVLASPSDSGARGVINLSYSYTFPLFAHYYDLERVASRYHLVLEPSWSGYCNEDILCYTQLSTPVFVQAAEPYDGEFLRQLGSNLVPVPLASNWWIDHRVLSDTPKVDKDLDFVMIAAWADYKRHHRFFAALRRLRRRGHRLVGACIGYPLQHPQETIVARAQHYGVADQIEFYQSLPQTEIAPLLRRAKVNVVWSRREGVNRAIIEGMFCGVPCLLPEGFNFGCRYPHVNEQTGRWANDRTLPDVLLAMTQSPGDFAPRAWVEQHMTPQRAVEILAQSISETCRRRDEPPVCNLAVKVKRLDETEYWDPQDENRFAADYAFLRSCIKR